MVSGNNYKRGNFNYSAKKAHPTTQRNMYPSAVLMKTDLKPLNTARPINTAHPKNTVYSARPMSHFSKSAQSTVKRPYQTRTTLTKNYFSQKVNNAKVKVYTARPKAVNTARPNLAVVNAIRENLANAVKASACWTLRNLMEDMLPLGEKPNEGKLLVKELLKLLADKSQVLLKVLRKNNMYSVDMKNILPKESLTCLFANATLDESIVQNRVISEFCEKKGIKKEFNVARTLQQNGVAERRILRRIRRMRVRMRMMRERESQGLDDEGQGLDDEGQGLEDEGQGLEDEGPGMEEEEEATPEGQQQAVLVVDTAMSEPLVLKYGETKCYALESTKEIAPYTYRPRQALVSPSSPVVPSPIASPVATLAATILVEEDQFLEVGAQLDLYRSILYDHTQRLDALPHTLFEGYNRDLRELQRYRFRSLEWEQERATVTFSAIWRPILDLERENQDLRSQLDEERHERLELIDRVARIEKRQEFRGDENPLSFPRGTSKNGLLDPLEGRSEVEMETGNDKFDEGIRYFDGFVDVEINVKRCRVLISPDNKILYACFSGDELDNVVEEEDGNDLLLRLIILQNKKYGDQTEVIFSINALHVFKYGYYKKSEDVGGIIPSLESSEELKEVLPDEAEEKVVAPSQFKECSGTEDIDGKRKVVIVKVLTLFSITMARIPICNTPILINIAAKANLGYNPKRYWEILLKEILGDTTQRDIGRYYPKRYWEILPKEILGDTTQRDIGR
ncbi:hypothetical protein Tco_0898092 [Tanacetum coccineum]